MSGAFPRAFACCRTLAVAVLFAGSFAARAGWSVAETGAGKAGCILETEEISLFDGYADTRLRLRVAEGAVRVMTESNIDAGFDDLGLAVDGGEFIPADAVVDEQDVLFKTGNGTLIDRFIRGHAVTVYLRFWPTYPATQRYAVRISLVGFTRAYNEYQACLSKQQT